MIDANLILCENLQLNLFETYSTNVVDLSSQYDPGEGTTIYLVVLFNAGFENAETYIYAEFFIQSSGAEDFPDNSSTSYSGAAMLVRKNAMFTGMKVFIPFNIKNYKYLCRYFRLKVKTSEALGGHQYITAYFCFDISDVNKMYPGSYSIAKPI